MRAKYVNPIGLLALAAWVFAVYLKTSKYIDNETILVYNVEQIKVKGPNQYVFKVKNTGAGAGNLEIFLDKNGTLKITDGVDRLKPIYIGYVCGRHRNCGKLSPSGFYNAKINVEILKILVHSYDEIKTPD